MVYDDLMKDRKYSLTATSITHDFGKLCTHTHIELKSTRGSFYFSLAYYFVVLLSRL